MIKTEFIFVIIFVAVSALFAMGQLQDESVNWTTQINCGLSECPTE